MSDYVLGTIMKNLNPYAITAGAVQGINQNYKFFRNNAVPTTGQMVSSFGGATYPYDELTTGTDPLELISTDANDTAGGTGARAVTIIGLDANYANYTETFAMNGTTAVEIAAGTFKRIFRMYSNSLGSYAIGGNTGKNKGTINLRMKATTNIVGQMPAETGVTLMSNYTVPANSTAFITNVGVYIEDSKIVDVAMYQRQGCDTIAAPNTTCRIVLTLDAIQTERTVKMTGAIAFPEKTDLWLEAYASTGTAQVDGYYEFFEIDNTKFSIP